MWVCTFHNKQLSIHVHGRTQLYMPAHVSKHNSTYRYVLACTCTFLQTSWLSCWICAGNFGTQHTWLKAQDLGTTSSSSIEMINKAAGNLCWGNGWNWTHTVQAKQLQLDPLSPWELHQYMHKMIYSWSSCRLLMLHRLLLRLWQINAAAAAAAAATAAEDNCWCCHGC